MRFFEKKVHAAIEFVEKEFVAMWNVWWEIWPGRNAMTNHTFNQEVRSVRYQCIIEKNSGKTTTKNTFAYTAWLEIIEVPVTEWIFAQNIIHNDDVIYYYCCAAKIEWIFETSKENHDFFEHEGENEVSFSHSKTRGASDYRPTLHTSNESVQ